MKRIVNATATMGEIVIDTLAKNIVRKGTVRETLWMIVIITKVETVTGRGLSIEKERRGTGQGHALARAAALNKILHCLGHGCIILRLLTEPMVYFTLKSFLYRLGTPPRRTVNTVACDVDFLSVYWHIDAQSTLHMTASGSTLHSRGGSADISDRLSHCQG
ncbi:hypothetical protein YC2023_032475 [Brassica napus]